MLDAYGNGVILKIQSSTDGTNWTDETWSVATTSANIAATNVNTTISHNLNSSSTLIAFTVTGNLYQYDYWYIDNVSISGTTSNLPVVSTSIVTSITSSSALSGGVVTSGGSSEVTARGVCFGTSANPDVSSDHTTDGSGTGTFSSTLEGLSASTTYHIRAYATNSFGTSYGNDLSFSTPCNSILPIAWMESFENGGAIPSCWTQEEVNSSGVNWTFIIGNGSGHPASAHTGIYNACLKDNNQADTKTRLITPALDLGNMISPILSFWHTQAVWDGDQDQLTVLYKTSASGNWITLATYTASITTWTQEIIILPSGTSEYYIAFEGNAKYGYGVCLDDVSITGSFPSLSVNPSYQDVEAVAGNALFLVISNLNWIASSNQPWCIVTPSGSGTGFITAAYEANTGGSARVAEITVTATGTLPVVIILNQEAPLEKILNLTVFIEGLFNGTDMNKAQNESGNQYPGSVADEITIEFHNAIAPFELVGQSYIVDINTDGTAQLSILASLNSSYYIVIKHRNSIETWSNAPVSFSGSAVSYNFTDAASRAFGNNLKAIEGSFVIYSGDVNQDGVVDSADMTPVDNDAALYLSGYLATDVNGDGIIDTADMTILDNNSASYIGVIAP